MEIRPIFHNTLFIQIALLHQLNHLISKRLVFYRLCISLYISCFTLSLFSFYVIL